MLLAGPAGSGKTYSALVVAAGMGARVAVIDTERNSAALYADDFDFDSLSLTDYSVESYRTAIGLAADYDVIVVDSLSHAWAGTGGLLEQQGAAAKRSGNNFSAWNDISTQQQRLIDTLLDSPAHVIATVRSKQEYTQDRDEKGRVAIRKLGMAPVQRNGIEYEFGIVIDLAEDHSARVTKTRFPEISGLAMEVIDAKFSYKIRMWLESGAAPAQRLSVLDDDDDYVSMIANSTDGDKEKIRTICASLPLGAQRDVVRKAFYERFKK